MRIISQSGEYDFPYEQIAVRRDENVVRVCPVFEKNTGVILGAYKTPEQAKKAMKMLRDCYAGCLRTESHYDTAAQANVSDIVVNNVTFQFPQDSEVRV